MNAQYAVVVQREAESWVRAAADEQGIAEVELDCLVATEGYDEWVAEVWSLAEQRRYAYSLRVEVRINDAVSAARAFARRIH